MFIITHRLPTLRNVDRIVTLEDGALVEEGAPRDLLAQGGRYAEFHRLQLGGANVERLGFNLTGGNYSLWVDRGAQAGRA